MSVEELFTYGDDEKIAYLEKENISLMQDNRILNSIIQKQDETIDLLTERVNKANREKLRRMVV
jgi:hypothetical protein